MIVQSVNQMVLARGRQYRGYQKVGLQGIHKRTPSRCMPVVAVCVHQLSVRILALQLLGHILLVVNNPLS